MRRLTQSRFWRTAAAIDYMHARYRSPVTSRFLCTDPVPGRPAAPQTWNRYPYTRGNPLIRVDPDGRADKGTGDGEISTVCGNHACPPSDPVGRTLNFLMIAAFAAPLEGAALASEVGGAVAISQASGAASGAISNPQAPVQGAMIGAATGTGNAFLGGGPLLTPLKNVGASIVSSVSLTGQADVRGAEVSAATGVAVGWLDLAARAGSKSPGGALLRGFSLGMDAFLQVLGAFGTSNSAPAPKPCSEANCS